MAYEIITSVVVIYSILFTGVLRISNFILKLEDKEIDNLLDRFIETIIQDNLNSLVGKKQLNQVEASDLHSLRKILNMPVEIDSLRKEEHRAGLWSFALLIGSGVTAVLSSMFPKWQIGSGNSFVIIPVLFTLAFFLWFWSYAMTLNKLKNKISEAKVIIQNKKMI